MMLISCQPIKNKSGSPKKLLLIACFIIANVTSYAQNTVKENFIKKIEIAQLILEKQPAKNDIKGMLSGDFKLDSANTTGYYIKCPDKSQMLICLYQNSERSVYATFFENNDSQKILYDFIEKAMKYTYVASEHNCDYYNNGNYSLCLCPDMAEGLRVHIEKMNN